MSVPGRSESGAQLRRAVHWAPAAALALTIFVLSSFPHFGALEHPILKESDKLIHGAVYALLAAAILWGLEEGFRNPAAVSSVWIAAAAAAVYGVSDEIHQRFVPGRMGIWQDWVADAIGAVVGAWIAWAFTRIRRRRQFTQIDDPGSRAR